MTTADITTVFTIHRMNNYKTIKSILKNIIQDKINPNKRRAMTSKTVTKIENNADLKKKCIDHQYCLIAFLNATNVEEEYEKFDNTMRILESYTRNPSFEKIRFNWIDISCHRHIFEKLGGDKVPGLFFFYNWRDTYSKFVGVWEPFVVSDYIERNLGDRIDDVEVPKNELFIEAECVVFEGKADEDISSKLEAQTDIENKTEEQPEIRKVDL